MHQNCCLCSLVRVLLKWKNSPERRLSAGGRRRVGELGTVIRCRKSHYSRWFGAVVRRASLPYLAFSSNRLLGFVTFRGPSAPVPPLSLNFLYLARSWDSLKFVRGGPTVFNSVMALKVCKRQREYFPLCSVFQMTAVEKNKIELRRTSQQAFLDAMFVTHSHKCVLPHLRSAGEIKKEQS